MMMWLTRIKLHWKAWRQRVAEGSTSGVLGVFKPEGPVSRSIVGAAVFGLVFVLYYGVGGFLISTIDDDQAFRPSPQDLPPNGSVTVAMMSGLMNRELNEHSWTADDPWFFPTALLDNMPAYQRGIRQMTLQVALELKDQVARTRGSGGIDADLEEAFSDLSYPPSRWWIGTDWPWIRSSSTSNYRDAVKALSRYNQRVAANDALFERRSDTLNAVLDRMALSLGAASNRLDKQVAQAGDKTLDFEADDAFYEVRGEAYAAYLILTGLQEDYAGLIRQRELANVWAELLKSLQELIALDPLIVANGEPGAMLVKNHLAEQGFSLLRARQQLREITAILQK